MSSLDNIESADGKKGIDRIDILISQVKLYRDSDNITEAQRKFELTQIIQTLEISLMEARNKEKKLYNKVDLIKERVVLLYDQKTYWEEEVVNMQLEQDEANMAYYQRHKQKIIQDAETNSAILFNRSSNKHRDDHKDTFKTVIVGSINSILPEDTPISEKRNGSTVVTPESKAKTKSGSKKVNYLGLGRFLEGVRKRARYEEKRKAKKDLGFVYPPRDYTSSDPNDDASFDQSD